MASVSITTLYRSDDATSDVDVEFSVFYSDPLGLVLGLNNSTVTIYACRSLISRPHMRTHMRACAHIQHMHTRTYARIHTHAHTHALHPRAYICSLLFSYHFIVATMNVIIGQPTTIMGYNITIIFSLSQTQTTNSSFCYATMNGSAIAGANYGAAAGCVVFPAFTNVFFFVYYYFYYLFVRLKFFFFFFRDFLLPNLGQKLA